MRILFCDLGEWGENVVREPHITTLDTAGHEVGMLAWSSQPDPWGSAFAPAQSPDIERETVAKALGFRADLMVFGEGLAERLRTALASALPATGIVDLARLRRSAACTVPPREMELRKNLAEAYQECMELRAQLLDLQHDQAHWRIEESRWRACQETLSFLRNELDAVRRSPWLRMGRTLSGSLRRVKRIFSV